MVGNTTDTTGMCIHNEKIHLVNKCEMHEMLSLPQTKRGNRCDFVTLYTPILPQTVYYGQTIYKH